MRAHEGELADRVLALDRLETQPDRLAEDAEVGTQPGREVERLVARVQRFRAVTVGIGHGPGYPSRAPRSPERTSKSRRSR